MSKDKGEDKIKPLITWEKYKAYKEGRRISKFLRGIKGHHEYYDQEEREEKKD